MGKERQKRLSDLLQTSQWTDSSWWSGMQAQVPESTCLSYTLYYLQVNKGTPEPTQALNTIYYNPLIFYIRKLLLFSHSVISDSLWPHGLQHTRLPCSISRNLLKLMSIESVVPSNHLILCHPLLFLLSIFPIRWPKFWSFSFSISPSNEHSWLISLGWTCWISLQSKGLSRVFSSITV